MPTCLSTWFAKLGRVFGRSFVGGRAHCVSLPQTSQHRPSGPRGTVGRTAGADLHTPGRVAAERSSEQAARLSWPTMLTISKLIEWNPSCGWRVRGVALRWPAVLFSDSRNLRRPFFGLPSWPRSVGRTAWAALQSYQRM